MTRMRRSSGVAAQSGWAPQRRLHGGVDLGGAAQRHPAGLLAERRVEHRPEPAAAAGDPAARR